MADVYKRQLCLVLCLSFKSASFSELEKELQPEIDAIETTYPDYDEYRYNLASIGHDPFALISYCLLYTSLAIWVPYEEVYRAYLLKLPRYELRIAENGIPEELSLIHISGGELR